MSVSATTAVLREAKAVLERNGWFQGEYVDRRPEFDGVALRECPVCLLGALNVAAGREADDIGMRDDLRPLDVLQTLIRRRGFRRPVHAWNDVKDRTVDDVLALLDEAIELVEAGDAR
ncbi:MAG TPA: hypothetical protein VL551_13675 [Actinospica sp.]|jgi:hypothetical protein|nr:hypothetical protein [Actinospica sp.]